MSIRWLRSATTRTAHALGSAPFLVVALVIGVAALVAGLLFTIPTPYQILMPGPTYNVQRLIQPAPPASKGALLLTTIYSDPASVGEWLFARANPEAGIIPREQARPREIGEREYQKILVTLMDESKIAAQVVALRAAGYDVHVTGQGVLVQDIAAYSKATDILRQGDIIVQAEGQPVATANDLVVRIQEHTPGDTIRLRVKRGDAELDLSIPLVEAPDEPGRARAGIAVVTHLYAYELPKELQLQTKDIGGPSAGLMFSLGVYGAVTGEDITRGHTIAGTGTIATDGKVGAVGGVKYKVVAAEKANAELFLVPSDNYQEARTVAQRVRVVPVADFSAALAALRELPPATSAA
jgi:PDZ domain-containing protein